MKLVLDKPKRKFVLFLVIIIVFSLLPIFVSSNYIVSTLVNCFIFATLGVAWNLIGGYGAQISWCHAAFVTIGAYSNFLMRNELGMTPWMSIPVGIVLSYIAATLIGYGTFRLRGAFFSIATIAFAEILRVLILVFKDFTGGASGLFTTYLGNSFLYLTFKNDIPFYYIMLIMLLLVVAYAAVFEKSKLGFYLGAIKGNEDAAESLGIEAFKIKLHAFQISAVITALVGTVYASFLTYIDPASICGMDLSVKIGVVAIIGGVGTLLGPVLGAFVIIPLIELTNILLGQQGGSQFLYGLALVLVVIFKPKGIMGLFSNERAIANILPIYTSPRSKEGEQK